MGLKNPEVFHNTDWENQSADRKPADKVVSDWLNYRDPGQYTYDNYYKCAEHLLTGPEFENTNNPAGYKYEQWTVKHLLDASERGEVLED
jgi:hypothetical protein